MLTKDSQIRIAVILSLFFLLFFVTEANGNDTSLNYVLRENGLMKLPACNDTTQGVVCASFLAGCGSFLLHNHHSSPSTSRTGGNSTTDGQELITLIHDRGILFFQPTNDGNLTLINELAVNCDQLKPIGAWKDQFLLVHSNSPRCTCQEPGKRPCPLQIQVLRPLELQGFINYIEGSVSKPIRSLHLPIEGLLVLANATRNVTDSVPSEGCSEFANAEEMEGNIALIYRGTCFFQEKVDFARQAGAIAVIIVNRKETPLVEMGVVGDIPTVMISFESGELLRTALSHTEVVVKLGRNTGTILAHPTADLPFGLGTIPIQDILEGKELTVTPNTHVFEWVDRGFAFDSDRGYLWLFRVGDTPNTLVVNISDGVGNLQVLRTYLLSPLVDIAPSMVTRDGCQYAIGVVPDGSAVVIYNVTDLDHVKLVSEVPTMGGDTLVTTTNGTVIYLLAQLSSHRIEVINATNLTSPQQVYNFTEIHGESAVVQPTGKFLSEDDEFLWISYSSLGVTVYDLRQDPFHPEKLAPLLDTTPQISQEYTVGVLRICGYRGDNFKAIGININDVGEQQLLQMLLEKKTRD
jgi:hypothetical protein